jgi:hypothetical protein
MNGGDAQLDANAISPWEEHRFWLEIIQDHAYFVRDHLSVSETRYVQDAEAYIAAFQSLLVQLEGMDRGIRYDSPEQMAFAQRAAPTADGYYRFEGHLQRLRIANQVNLNLSPTYLNGTLNENQEYLRLLSFAVQGIVPKELPLVDLLDLWLEDQLGHAILLANVLDPAEFGLQEQAAQFAQTFRALFTKNELIRGYLRFSPPQIPVQLKLARDTLLAVQQFYALVERVITQYEQTELLDRTTLRFLEHHLPESCYFMRKLVEQVPGQAIPANCSLTKPTFVMNRQLPTDPPVI